MLIIMDFPKIGEKAPSFTLPATTESELSLDDFAGKNIVLYFYPKDGTSGCTLEALNFKEYHEEYQKLDAVIIGISKDSVKSHKKFIEKNTLPFVLLSDEDTKVNQLYQVWKAKKMYGKEYMGTERSTFIIDKRGILRDEFRKVKVKGHAEAVLESLKKI